MNSIGSSRTEKAKFVRAMFARIVPRYDIVNRLMTFGFDRHWRRVAAHIAEPRGCFALDVATGTGELAFELERQGCRGVIGVDFCTEMMMEALRKRGAERLPGVSFVAGDALTLPFPDASFDCVVSAFLLRNVADLPRALGEFRRILKPGGRLACLEITHPPAVLRPFFWLYFDKLVPLLGGLVSGDFSAYRYLPQSLKTYPDADRLAGMIAETGLLEVSYRRLGIGTVAIHGARKGSDQSMWQAARFDRA